MTLVFVLLAALIVSAAALAFALRNLVHSALLLVGVWGGLAAVYLWAGAEFVAFAQLLIYVGAVSMIVLFAVILTRPTHADPIVARPPVRRTLAAILAGGAVTAVLAAAVLGTSFPEPGPRAPSVSVRQLGYQLMNQHAAALLIVGVILTVALIGATVIAVTEAGRSGHAPEPVRPGPTGPGANAKESAP